MFTGPWTSPAAGFVSVQCTPSSCTKTCSNNSATQCNGYLLNAVNVSNLSGSITMLPIMNNVIVLINCSQDNLECHYISDSADVLQNLPANSIRVIEGTNPNNSATYDCVKI